MGTSKTIGEAAAMLEPHGFRLEGVNGNGHYVFREPQTGAIARVGTGAIVSKKHRANIVNQAQRSVRHAQSVSHRWVNWLLAEFNIGEAEEREVRFPVMVMAEKFLAEHPDVRGTSKGLWLIALKNSPLAEEVASAPKGYAGERAISTWRLRGPLFGVRPVTEEVGAGETIYEGHPKAEVADETTQMEEPRDRGLVDAESRSEPGADRGAGDLPRDGDAGAGGGPEGAESRTEDAGRSEGGDDETRVVGAGGREARPPRPVIPEDLAAALAEHFSGDLRAENELLRSALEQSLAALQGAAQTLQEALSLGERQVQGNGKHRGMGPKNLRRWDLMREYRTELDGPLTAEKLHRFFVEHGERSTHAVAASVLWTLDHNGLLRRGDAAGVYLWL